MCERRACAYTESPWQQTRAALECVLAQRPEPARVQLSVAHNADLATRARREFVGVSAPESDGTAGHLGARSTGLRAATQGHRSPVRRLLCRIRARPTPGRSSNSCGLLPDLRELLLATWGGS
jgi:hypothetical protein